MNLLLVIEDVAEAVRYVLLDRAIRLGGAEAGNVPISGLDRTVAVIEHCEEGLLLEPRGLVTVLVNDRPPAANQPLVPGDRVTLGQAIAGVVEADDTAVVNDSARAAEAPLPAAAGSIEGTFLRRLEEILVGTRDEVDLMDRALGLALESTAAARAATLVRDVDGRIVVRRIRADGLEGEVVLSGDLVEAAATDPVLASVDGGTRALLIVPVRGRRPPAAWLALEWRTAPGGVEARSVVAAEAVGVALGAALEAVRRQRVDATTERLATIGLVMAGVAHDLKNLISGLRTGVFYLNDTLTSHEEPRVREAWSIMKGAQTSIQALVSDMVAYSKRESPELERADLAAVVRKAIDLTRDRAKSRSVTVEADLDPEAAPLMIDPPAIERCLVNLLVNAIDAAPAGSGRVAASLTVESDETVLRVSDDGPGIPDGIRERVFDLLYSTKGARGTGFGLAITREIVEAHGGTVDLEAAGDPGATFAIRLPVV